ncbi:MAG TPA: PLD nuclease N-terminal domain-containing protein [Actinomycetota bacterium]|nr:PLD nuclease N-terminal domain-containing protein [Actinomycetota bacterium]
MLYLVALLFSLGLLVFCVLECIATDSSLVRNLPKALWILLIVLLPPIGAVAWLLLGRPEKTRYHPGDARSRPNAPAARPKRPLGPDDDPRFQEMTRHIGAPPPKAPERAGSEEKAAQAPSAGEHGVNELKAWEQDLRRREEELRRRLEGESSAGD